MTVVISKAQPPGGARLSAARGSSPHQPQTCCSNPEQMQSRSPMTLLMRLLQPLTCQTWSGCKVLQPQPGIAVHLLLITACACCE